MTTDHRATPGLIHEVLDALERHGYYRSDDLHAARAIGLIGDLACIYEGTQDHPVHSFMVPPSAPAYPEPGNPGTATLTRDDASTVFAALDIAADDKRYRVEMCPDCADRSCPDCQTHLHDIQAFDQMAGRMLQATQAVPVQPGPARIAGPSPPPTGRQASDALPPETSPASQPARRYAPRPRPAAGRAGHAGDRRPLRPAVPRPVAAPPGVRGRRRPAPRLAA